MDLGFYLECDHEASVVALSDLADLAILKIQVEFVLESPAA